jgi:hypothetical protein
MLPNSKLKQMKKPAATIFLLIMTLNLLGQDEKFQAGIEGGAGIAHAIWSGNSSGGTDPMLGFTAGISFQWNITNLFGIRTGLSYDRKGFSNSYDDLIFDNVYSWLRNDYLVIPVLARLTFGKQFKWFVNAGPYFGYLVRAITYNEMVFSDQSPTSNVTSVSDRFDAGISLGFGIAFPVYKHFGLSFEIRDNFGLVKLQEAYRLNAVNLTGGIFYSWGNKK